jgi:hypothetical protein
MTFRGIGFGLLIGVMAFCAVSANAASVSVAVPGVADIWLAGQPSGTVLQGAYANPDVAPANSPVLASSGLTLTAGSYVTVTATGGTDYNGCATTTPDGHGACGTYTTATGALGISGVSVAPLNSLVGVFVNSAVPSGTPPAAMAFVTDAATISPALNQVFFIGDGLTGTGSGSAQHFVVPAGATRLYLGSLDGIGASYNNLGSFTVTVSDAPPSSVPALSTFGLFLTALLLLAGGALFLRGRASRV